MDVFKLFGTIALNGQQQFGDDVDKAEGKGKRLGESLKQAFSKAGNFAKAAGKDIALGLGAGVTAMAGLTKKAMDLAGELEQNMGGSEAVFGEYAQRMQDTAARAFTNMGISASDYLATANKMGSLFQGVGYDQEESATMTEEAMQRAADVASIMGIDAESAMEAVAGMAKGNFTMMDNLGVAINDTSIGQYALSKGITKSTTEMSTQEKVMLAYNLFMEKTTQYTGNYAKENATLAGSLQTAKAAMENFLSGAGDADQLADAFVNAGDVIIENLNTLFPRLTSGLTQLIKKLTPKIPGMVKSILPGLITGAVALLTGLVAAAPDLIGVLVDMLPDVMEQLGTAIAQTWPVLVDGIMDLVQRVDWKQMGTWIGNGIRSLIENLPQILRDIGNAISFAWNNIVWPIIQGLFSAVFKIELPDWTAVWDGIKSWWGNVTSAFGDYFSALFTINTTDKDGNGLTWDQVISQWFKGVLGKVGDLFFAILGVKTSDEDENHRPWSEIIIEWWKDLVSGFKDQIYITFGIKPENNALQQIKDWWNNTVLAGLGIMNVPYTYTRTDTGEVDTVSGASLTQQWGGDTNGGGSKGFATGLDFVPRDNFAANLHQGEAVLTRDEASAWRAGRAGGNDDGALTAALAQLNSLMQQVVTNTGGGRQVVLDTGVLVGQMAGPMDAALGNINSRRARRG